MQTSNPSSNSQGAVSTKWSLVLIHEGYTTTLKILERGFLQLSKAHGLDFRTVEFRSGDELEIETHEIPLFIRCVSPWSAGLANQLTEIGRPYFYYLDDDLMSLDISTDLGRYYRQPLILSAYRQIISGANLVITNSKTLAKRIVKLNDNVEVLPAFFDFELLPSRNGTSVEIDPSLPVKIGFASNISRLRDLKGIEGVLLETLTKYPNCEVDIVGLLPVQLAGHPRVQVFPHLTSYEDYIRFQLSRSWQIGLAPLRNTKQNSAKTNNKYREYGAMGIPGVYADLAPYGEVIHRVTGMKVSQSPRAWKRCIEELLEDHSLRSSIRDNAFSDVRAKYDIALVMNLWFEKMEHSFNDDLRDPAIWDKRNFHSSVSKFYVLWYVFRTHTPMRAMAYFINTLRTKSS